MTGDRKQTRQMMRPTRGEKRKTTASGTCFNCGRNRHTIERRRKQGLKTDCHASVDWKHNWKGPRND